MHYRINEIGDIQTEDPRHKGLTPFGRDVVTEMNKLGMVIDVAHASSETLSDILAESRYPVICSHTGAYALWSHARHLENKDMTAIAKKGPHHRDLAAAAATRHPGDLFASDRLREEPGRR
jgi:membrane dipeptidase